MFQVWLGHVRMVIKMYDWLGSVGQGYRVINEDSNIAICTLWSRVKDIETALGGSIVKVGIIGNLYSTYGINHIIKTLAMFNKVDTLIIYGLDLNGVGDALLGFFTEGKLEPMLIPRHVADVVRSTVRLVDLRRSFARGDANSLIEAVEASYRPNTHPVRDRLIVELSEDQWNGGWALPLSGAFIYETSAFRAWVKLLDLVMNFGFDKPDGDGLREFLNIMVSLKVSKELLSRLRLTEWISIDHEPILRIIRSDPHSPWAMYRGDGFMVQGMISGDHYNQTIYINRLDIYREWSLWVYSSLRLAERIIQSLNAEFNSWYELGHLVFIAFSGVIRRRDLEEARAIVNRNSGVFREFVQDPRGNFIVMRDGDRVIVEHREPRSNVLISRVAFMSLGEAYSYFKNKQLFSECSHALYLGKELARAFMIKDYVQDEEVKYD